MSTSAHLALWAKLGNETWPNRYHPLLCHLIDVAAVAQQIYETVFRPRFRQWLAERLGLDELGCARWVAFLCGAHDIGKAAACFQDRNNERTSALKKRLQAAGFSLHGADRSQHGTISAAVLADLLANPTGWPAVASSFAWRLAVAVGGHHGLFPSDWMKLSELLHEADWDRPWHAARREILQCLAGLLRLGDPSPQRPDSADQAVFMVLAGLTSVADWIGSNQAFFEPVGNPDVAEGRLEIERYFEWATGQARHALQQLGWLGREPAAGPRTFRELFAGIVTGEPRDLQVKVEQLANELNEPALLLVEAPMGEGKTEAAWYVADRWDHCGGQGTYVALPTMATSNQMYERVGEFLKANPGKKNLMLQHGKAALNEAFAKLQYAAQVYDDDQARPSAVVAEAWFAANKKHGLLAPYGVGTIDQGLLAVLQTKHMFVRLFGLAGKCVILDEVHAYDAYMSTLLERLLQWLAALGCPVVLLSATLPAEKRQKLLQAYAHGTSASSYADRSYPRVTLLRPGRSDAVHVESIAADAKRARTVRLDRIAPAALAERLKTALAGGGCAAVIRNTVGLAQQTYGELRQALAGTGIEVELFHARFPFGKRAGIEDRVLRRYGKGPDGKPDNPQRPPKAVLVATQVIEQSLDLDFDLLVSDLAPVDLVLQRAGRLWRHERTERGGIPEATLWLLDPVVVADGVPSFGPSEKVYARHVLLRSFLALRGRDVVRLPADLEPLVEAVYGPDAPQLPDPAWQHALDASRGDLMDSTKKQRLSARGLAVRTPDDESLLEQQSLQLEEDDPQAHERIRAATRDTEPSVQLIIIYRGPGGDALDAGGTQPIRLNRKPDRPQVKQFLANEVTITHPGCVAFYARQAPPTAWRENGLLRYHRVVVVGPDGVSLPGEFSLQVDPGLGVLFLRPEERED